MPGWHNNLDGYNVFPLTRGRQRLESFLRRSGMSAYAPSTYTPFRSDLYVDGVLATTGPGVLYLPATSVISNGFFVGSDHTGTAQSRGLIDDMVTYNYALGPSEVTNDYATGMQIISPSGGGFRMDDGDGGISPGGFSGGGGGYPGSYIPYTWNTNLLWLNITNMSGGVSYLNLFNATNQVYAIWSTTNLLTAWQVEAEVWPTDTNCMPFTLQTLNRQELFLQAEDWTGVTENGNTTPDWWFWMYFGTTALFDTNLDSQGNTLVSDYTNEIDPNVVLIQAINTTNSYVNTNSVPAYLSYSGTPYYVAILVDDTNSADATWNTYNPSNFVINLGAPTQGWHQILVGLRGHADATNAASWTSRRLK